MSTLTQAFHGAAETLKDQQSNVLASLSQLIDFSTVQHEDGSVDVSIGNGRGLVMGANAYSLVATSTGSQGFATLSIGSYETERPDQLAIHWRRLRRPLTLIRATPNTPHQLAVHAAS